jgi:hypothetical protein
MLTASLGVKPTTKKDQVSPALETPPHQPTRYSILNTQFSSKRLANVVTTMSTSKKPALTLENYPCIIPDPKHKGRWIELRCYICQGNAREDGLFLKGLKGLKRHMQLSHKPHFSDLPLKQQFSLEASTVRSFNRQDLDDMLAGKIERVQMITCAREVNVGEEAVIKIEDQSSGVLAPGDRPFDFLEAWPTIILREDMIWVEIRCFSVSSRFQHQHGKLRQAATHVYAVLVRNPSVIHYECHPILTWQAQRSQRITNISSSEDVTLNRIRTGLWPSQ